MSQRYTERRGANHGLHIVLSILTCGLWAITGWPIAAALGRKTTTTIPTYQAPPGMYPQPTQQQPPPQAYGQQYLPQQPYQAPPYYGPQQGQQPAPGQYGPPQR
ncbi:hypothetical protein ACFW9O_17740 [Streptomyces sp. NPDC059499]|uniref:hypothetical protein n=1 Tax=Streptomyces sp. NPDC059499 TaxID=3346852 RepID=UPI0036C20308